MNDEPQSPKNTKTARSWIWLGLVLFLGCCGCPVWALLYDDSSVRDQELASAAFDQAENAYPVLVDFAQKSIQWPDTNDDFIAAWERDFLDVDEEEKPRDPFPIAPILVKLALTPNEAQWPQLREILKQPLCPPKMELLSDSPELLDLRNIVNILCLQARKDLLDGRQDKALERIDLALELSRKIHERPSCFIYLLVARACQGIVLGRMRDFAGVFRWRKQELKHWIGKLEALKNQGDAIVFAYKAEYQMLKRGLQDSTTNLKQFDGPFFGGVEQTSPLERFMRPFTFKPNRTLNGLVVNFKEMIADLDRPYPDIKNSAKQGSFEDQRSKWLTGNAQGLKIIDCYDQLRLSYGTSAKDFQNRVSATQMTLLLLHSEAQTGQLPSSLEAFAKAAAESFPKGLPKDQFNGQSFHYLPKKRLLYSVGEDLVDQGGVEGSDRVYRLPKRRTLNKK